MNNADSTRHCRAFGRSTVAPYARLRARLSAALRAAARAALCAALGATLWGTAAVADDTGTAVADSLERGRYLVTIAVCNDCHTPWIDGPNGPEPDMSRMLSGHPQDLVMPPSPAPFDDLWLGGIGATNTAWAGPWGVSFTANLTPDEQTGLGKWTLENFVETIRTGRHLGRGRPLLPPMPIPMYRHFTDEDLAAIFAYLQSIPPVSNRVPAPIVDE